VESWWIGKGFEGGVIELFIPAVQAVACRQTPAELCISSLGDVTK
jgi:hypothetical protein